MSDTSLIFNFLKGRNTVSPETKKIANDVRFMAFAMKAASVVAVAATVAMAAGIAGLVAQSVALVAAITPALNVIALLPSLLFAAGAGFAAVKLATGGLGDALKRSAGGGAAAGAAIAAAEKRVAAAQREALAAQKALNDAREAAAERLQNLALALARARLDEEAATLAVADARRALREAQRTGDRTEILRANLAYREAVQTLAEVRERLEDVTTEQARATEAGVEGSDEVVAAVQRQTDALDALKEAQDALSKAGSGGGADRAAEAYAKLSLSGKQLVDVIKALRPQWASLRTELQQTTFAGVAADVQALSNSWLPVLRVRLAQVGLGWNMALRGSAQLAASAGYVNDMNAALGDTATFWQRVGTSFAPFLSGFRHFTVVGATFLPQIGAWVLSLGQRFDRWAASARATGRAHDWIARALEVTSQFWQVLKNLGGVIAAIFRAGDAGPAWLPGLVEGTGKLRAYLSSTEGQEKLGQVFATLRDVGSQVWQIITALGPAFLNLFAAGGPVVDTMSVFGTVVGVAADHLDELAKLLPFIVGLFIAYKAASASAVVIEAVRLPITIAQTVASFALARAMNANTAAILGNEAAQRKGLIALAASKVAMVAQAAWTGIVTAAQWLWNAAMYANPIGLIILAIIALVAGIVLLWTHSEGFRNFFIKAWDHIWSFLKMIGAWFAGPFVDFFVGAWRWIVDAAKTAVLWIHDNIQVKIVDFITSLPSKIANAARGMWDGIVHAFKGAINWLISLWNRIDFGVNIRVPDWVPGIGGHGFIIPDLLPDLPYLEHGGTIMRGGAAVVADRNGQGGEVVSLPRGAQVTPLPGGAGAREVRLVIDLRGADEDFKRLFRKWVRIDGGGDVQVAFGS